MGKLEIRYFGVIRNGRRIYYNQELHERQLANLEGKEFEEIIKEKSKRVSTSTHGYYRGGILPSCINSSSFDGWTEDEVHEYYANKFLRHTYEKILGDKRIEIVIIKSTGDLNQSEMNYFVEQVSRDCAEKGIEILPPEQYNLTKYRVIKKDEFSNIRQGNPEQ